MHIYAGVAKVIFDAATRRFKGHVHLSENGVARVIRASTPGHPSWSHKRIQAALVSSALSHEGMRHAGF